MHLHPQNFLVKKNFMKRSAAFLDLQQRSKTAAILIFLLFFCLYAPWQGQFIMLTITSSFFINEIVSLLKKLSGILSGKRYFNHFIVKKRL